MGPGKQLSRSIILKPLSPSAHLDLKSLSLAPENEKLEKLVTIESDRYPFMVLNIKGHLFTAGRLFLAVPSFAMPKFINYTIISQKSEYNTLHG
jgi:hypothetical protein